MKKQRDWAVRADLRIELALLALLLGAADVARGRDCNTPPSGFGLQWWSEYKSWCTRNGRAAQKRVYGVEYLAQQQATQGEKRQAQESQKGPLTGTWRDKETGDTYSVTLTGNEFEARTSLYPHWDLYFHGSLNGTLIEGTFKAPEGHDSKWGCKFPAYEMPFTGSISEDGKLITIHFQLIVWGWHAHRGSFRFRYHCVEVKPDHMEEHLAILNPIP